MAILIVWLTGFVLGLPSGGEPLSTAWPWMLYVGVFAAPIAAQAVSDKPFGAADALRSAACAALGFIAASG